MTEDWFWAAARNSPAGDKFVVANGQDALWRRVRKEVAEDERCAWNPVHPDRPNATIEDILEMMFTVLPVYRVNQNRFVMEVAQIPVFARFLKNARHDVGNYVSNSMFPDELIPLESYSPTTADKLGLTVSRTLQIEPDWYEV